MKLLFFMWKTNEEHIYDKINCLLILSSFFDLILNDSPVDLTSYSRRTRSKIQFQENMVNLWWYCGAW